MRRTIYLSGPMTGILNNNYPAFNAAAKDLRARGFYVENPAEINANTGRTRYACLRHDIAALCKCDGIILLPGWEKSEGANLELHVARALGLTVEFYYPN